MKNKDPEIKKKQHYGRNKNYILYIIKKLEELGLPLSKDTFNTHKRAFCFNYDKSINIYPELFYKLKENKYGI